MSIDRYNPQFPAVPNRGATSVQNRGQVRTQEQAQEELEAIFPNGILGILGLGFLKKLGAPVGVSGPAGSSGLAAVAIAGRTTAEALANPERFGNALAVRSPAVEGVPGRRQGEGEEQDGGQEAPRFAPIPYTIPGKRPASGQAKLLSGRPQGQDGAPGAAPSARKSGPDTLPPGSGGAFKGRLNARPGAWPAPERHAGRPGGQTAPLASPLERGATLQTHGPARDTVRTSPGAQATAGGTAPSRSPSVPERPAAVRLAGTGTQAGGAPAWTRDMRAPGAGDPPTIAPPAIRR